MYKILIATLNNINSNPRPNRLLKYLYSNGFDVSLLSFYNANDFNIKFIKLNDNSLSLLSKIASAFNNNVLLNYVLNNNYKSKIINDFDIIFCCNIELLPLVFKIKNNSKVVIDLREHFPSQYDSLKWKLLYKNVYIYILKEYVVKSDKVITVGELISKEYKKEFNFDSEVLMSLPDKGEYKSEVKNKYDKIKIVHHGVGLRKRKIENMINMINYLDDKFTLDIYLVNKNRKYYDYLLNLVKDNKNVNILKPVDYNDINSMLSQYDIGLFYLENSNINLKYALPNKLFEYIQAGLCLAFSPNDEMKNIINIYDVGFVSNSFDIKELAEKINCLSDEELNRYKLNSIKAADILNVEENNKLLDNIIKILSENA